MADDELRNALAGDSVVGSDGRQYAVEPYRNPLASSSFKQFEWAKNNPQIASSLAELLKYLSFMPMGRSTAGARIGHDNVMARRLDQKAREAEGVYDRGITGGMPDAPRSANDWHYDPIARSSTGLAYEPGMRSAGAAAAEYGGMGYSSPWTEPANINVLRRPGGKKD